MKVIAIFIGPEYSLGFYPHSMYTLTITGNRVTCGNKVCSYGSIETFFKNWRVVSNLITD